MSKYVVLTRPKQESDRFAQQITKLGLQTLSFPSLIRSKNLSVVDFKRYVFNISSYSWILFTSSSGVRFFMDGLKEIGEGVLLPKEIRIAAVGLKTAQAAKTYGLFVDFIPSMFTAEDLAEKLPNISGINILLPRSNIGNPILVTKLKKRGAHVTDMPVYKTEFLKQDIKILKKLLASNQILCFTFTSPSTVEGFMRNIYDETIKIQLLSLPVCSIGPVTTKKIKNSGFTNVFTAERHTMEGMIRKIKESIL